MRAKRRTSDSLPSPPCGSLLAVARDNFDLTKYLIGQVLQSSHHRFAALQEYFPGAKPADWRLEVAGQRVQIIKPDARRGGILEFGTELVPAPDGSLIALFRMVDRIVFPYIVALQAIPKVAIAPLMVIWFGFGLQSKMIDDADLCRRVRADTAAVLHLQNV